jgi:hypothetical protein
MGQSRDGRIQNKWNQKEKNEIADLKIKGSIDDLFLFYVL